MAFMPEAQTLLMVVASTEGARPESVGQLKCWIEGSRERTNQQRWQLVAQETVRYSLEGLGPCIHL